ncbi:hypothetical protein HZC09_04140 [Candidatus Micrarchaeota archaeon]|nr:hypothetical protein [Candidatus Micrarchaeota archaeon]
MVDLQDKKQEDNLCAKATRDSRKVPIEIWVQQTKPVVEKLTQWRKEHKIEFAAFGATALGALGYARPTKDVDLVIKPQEWAFSQISQTLSEEFGFTRCPRGTGKVQMLAKEIGGFHFVVELWDNYIYVMDCDEAMWARTRIGQNLGFPAITLSTEDMVSSKLGRFFVEHAQEDITDIAFLLKEHGIRDYAYFAQRIQKIRRSGKTIDDFLFEEMLSLAEIIGKKPATLLHTEIVKRRPYRQLLERIMFRFSKQCKNAEEISELALLTKKETEAVLGKLGIEQTGKGFQTPKGPDSIISRILLTNP